MTKTAGQSRGPEQNSVGGGDGHLSITPLIKQWKWRHMEDFTDSQISQNASQFSHLPSLSAWNDLFMSSIGNVSFTQRFDIPNQNTVTLRLWPTLAVLRVCYEIVCSLQNRKCAKGRRGSCTCYNNDSSARYSICKYMQILSTHCICVISAQKKMSTLLCFGSHCLPYFPPHQLGMLEHPQCLAETCVYFTFLWASPPVMLSRATVEHRGTGALAIQAHSEIWSVIFSLSAGSRSHSWHVF